MTHVIGEVAARVVAAVKWFTSSRIGSNLRPFRKSGRLVAGAGTTGLTAAGFDRAGDASSPSNCIRYWSRGTFLWTMMKSSKLKLSHVDDEEAIGAADSPVSPAEAMMMATTKKFTQMAKANIWDLRSDSDVVQSNRY